MQGKKNLRRVILGKVMPVVCAKLISRKEQSITQLNVSNGWYYQINIVTTFKVLLTVHHAMILGNCPT